MEIILSGVDGEMLGRQDLHLTSTFPLMEILILRKSTPRDRTVRVRAEVVPIKWDLELAETL